MIKSVQTAAVFGNWEHYIRFGAFLQENRQKEKTSRRRSRVRMDSDKAGKPQELMDMVFEFLVADVAERSLEQILHSSVASIVH